MPIGVFLWLIGWSLYWIGYTKESRRPKTEQTNQTWLTFIESAPEVLQEKAKQRISSTT
jgi:hypothetical protein